MSNYLDFCYEIIAIHDKLIASINNLLNTLFMINVSVYLKYFNISIPQQKYCDFISTSNSLFDLKMSTFFYKMVCELGSYVCTLCHVCPFPPYFAFFSGQWGGFSKVVILL